MAKASDLIGKSGVSGFGPQPTPGNIVQIQSGEKKAEKEDHSIPKQKPVKDFKPNTGGSGPTGGGKVTSVRPKV